MWIRRKRFEALRNEQERLRRDQATLLAIVKNLEKRVERAEQPRYVYAMTAEFCRLESRPKLTTEAAVIRILDHLELDIEAQPERTFLAPRKKPEPPTA